jgi:hypothetical protein
MAAPVKNRAPRAPTDKGWNSKPPIAPSQSQQTAPATAKTMARIRIANTFRTSAADARSNLNQKKVLYRPGIRCQPVESSETSIAPAAAGADIGADYNNR